MAKKGGKTAVWILMGLLILGLGGFGATSFSSSLRSIGSVGDQQISTGAYGRALQEEMRAVESQMGQALSFEQAQAFGLPTRTLARLVNEAALDDEAARAGLSVGDEILAEQLQTIPAFRGIDGEFDRDAYRFALDRAGLTEATFEDSLRRETARTLMQGAIVSGRAVTDIEVDTMLGYLAERRRVTWARVGQDLLDTQDFDPSEEELQAIYEEEIEGFTLPERKRITYVWLAPEMILDQVEVDEELLRREYEAREAEFNRPERRLVERLIYSDTAAAEAAAGRLADGAASFEDLVRDRGLDLSDIDLGDVTEAELDAAGAPVFAAETGDVVGPVDTAFGPALFRVNGVLAAEETAYEDAVAILREDLLHDRAARQVSAEAEPIEDLLASGATLEEIAAETDMQLGTVDWAPGQAEGIAGYEGFAAEAEALQEGDFPEVKQLTDGGIYAMRLDEILPPEPTPFAEVRPRVVALYETRRTMEGLRELAQGYVGRLQESAGFDTLGLEVQTEEAMTRSSNVLGTPEAFATRVFEMEAGEIALVDGFGSVLVVQLDEVLPPNLEDPDTAALRDNLSEQLSNSIAQDIYRAFAEDVRLRAGVDIDQQAINAIHANFQ